MGGRLYTRATGREHDNNGNNELKKKDINIYCKFLGVFFFGCFSFPAINFKVSQPRIRDVMRRMGRHK